MTFDERTMRWIVFASPRARRRFIESLTPLDLMKFDAAFEAWAHKNQLPPSGVGWRVWLMLAGRGYGKTRAGAEWIHRLAMGKRGVQIALVGASIAEARAVMVEGVSGLLAIAALHGKRVKWEPSLGKLTWPNGSEARIFSGDHPDGLRGPEHDFAWCDELAKWSRAEEAWDNLQLGLRRGSRPRALITTTPKSLQLLQRIRADQFTVTTTGRTSDNINLSEQFIEVMSATYGGTRLGRQELDGELIVDVEGALWTREMISAARAPAEVGRDRRKFGRMVVGVDPPAGVGAQCDACGIVVAGAIGEDFYVLEDASVQGLSPEGWANRVAAAAARWDTSAIVAEANNGGAMVKSVIDAAGVGLNVRLVHASKGKSARAEPVALRFEAGKAFFAGRFDALEDELAGMQAGGGYEGPGRSPDRADAMVWAMTALGESRSGVPRVRRL